MVVVSKLGNNLCPPKYPYAYIMVILYIYIRNVLVRKQEFLFPKMHPGTLRDSLNDIGGVTKTELQTSLSKDSLLILRNRRECVTLNRMNNFAIQEEQYIDSSRRPRPIIALFAYIADTPTRFSCFSRWRSKSSARS